MNSGEPSKLIGIVFDSGLDSGDFRQSVASMKCCDEVYVPVESLEHSKTSDVLACGAKPLITEKNTPYQCLEALKNSGVQWLLILDDRETLSEGFQEEIRKLIGSEASAFLISRTQTFKGASIDSVMDSASSIALADLSRVEIHPNASHHQIVRSDSPQKLTVTISRHAFKDFSDCVRWMDHESDERSKVAVEVGKNICVAGSLFKGFGVFINRYFFKGGRKLGVPGLFLCVNLGMLRFLTAIKHREAVLGIAKVPV